MREMKLGAIESKFADIIWKRAPIPSRELARICEEELGWKRTTTYTVLKKLCDRGLFENRNGLVQQVLTREDFYGMQGEQLVEEAFSGSLPAFIAAFTKRKALTEEEIAAIRDMIEHAGEV